MHFDWNAVLSLLVVIVGGVIRHSIKTPSDQERAALLRTLADDAAAVIVNLNPGADWAKLVASLVQRLADDGATPTANRAKLESAAVGALVRLGITKTP